MKGLVENRKIAVAVFFGGASSEYGVSLESAYSVICHLDREKYEPVPVGITREGNWFFSGEMWRRSGRMPGTIRRIACPHCCRRGRIAISSC